MPAAVVTHSRKRTLVLRSPSVRWLLVEVPLKLGLKLERYKTTAL